MQARNAQQGKGNSARIVVTMDILLMNVQEIEETNQSSWRLSDASAMVISFVPALFFSANFYQNYRENVQIYGAQTQQQKKKRQFQSRAKS